MISFAYPKLLYLLLLLPVVAALFVWGRLSRRRKLRRFGKPSVLAALMPDASSYMPWVKLSVALAALAMLVFTAARPRATATLDDTTARETSTSRGIEVMVAVDVSNSMLASSTDDPRGSSRLDRAKHLLERLLKTLRDDKVGLIVFAGEAYTQLPITADYVSAAMFIKDMDPSMVPVQGTAIGAAIDMAAASFSGDDRTGRAIILLTDAENFEDDAEEAAARAASAGIQVDVIGFGTEGGAPIIIDRARNRHMTDAEGNPVVTAFNPAIGRQIAKAGKGVYVAGNSNSAVADLDTQLDTLAKSEFKRHTFTPQSEQFPVFAWLALALLVLDCLTVNRKLSWFSRITFFTRRPAGELTTPKEAKKQ